MEGIFFWSRARARLRVVAFLRAYFYPDEPIFRSTRLVEDSDGSNGLVNKYIANLVKKPEKLVGLK